MSWKRSCALLAAAESGQFRAKNCSWSYQRVISTIQSSVFFREMSQSGNRLGQSQTSKRAQRRRGGAGDPRAARPRAAGDVRLRDRQAAGGAGGGRAADAPGGALSRAALAGERGAAGQRRGAVGFRPAAPLLPHHAPGSAGAESVAGPVDAHQAFRRSRIGGFPCPRPFANRIRR